MKHLAIALAFALLPTIGIAFEFRITTNALTDALRQNSLLTPLAEAEEGAPAAQDVIAAAQADYARLVAVLYDRGYFAPTVSILIDGREAATLSPVQPPRQIGTVELRVTTGRPFVFGTARIAPLPQGTQLPEGFATGQTASTGTLQSAATEGTQAWRNAGHAKANVQSQSITAHHDTGRLDVDVTLAPGPRLRFGDLQITGNERMRTQRIIDIAGLQKGTVYDPAKLDLVATRLRRTGVFSVVALSEADTVTGGDQLDIIAQFAENKPRRFGFGAELSTQDGLSLSAFWLHRNLFGGAERLRIGADISGIGGDTGGEDFDLTVAFRRPATFNEDTDFYVDGQLSSLEEPNFALDRFSLEAGIHRYASAQREYTLGIGLDIADTTDAFGRRSYSILTLPLGAEFDYRDDSLNATDGYYANATLTPFLNLQGSANGLRGSLDARTYHSFGKAKRVTFALRGQLGFLVGPSLSEAPTDFLFYSGGGGTVRGHDFQSLGVDIGGGNTVGGRSFLGLSGEIRVKTGDKLSIVGFYDAGYIGSEEFPDASSGDWQTGAGLGIRYDTGIGPVRLDVGVPVSGPDTSGGAALYIGIGQSF
ncbi:BamA/TamA family outer membrane protein [Ascidiaceihabitans sp.]|uniref:autotransporter assembly complex protein TamA n=1 Tax=Ascidiaceihabitans sp. TaxID=1872644 RepID=UPI0032986CEC